MTSAELGRFIAGRIKQFVSGKLDPLQSRIDALEKRLGELETKGIEYLGVHEPGATYKRGQIVTHGGSMWHANRVTASRPGEGSAWTLCVKRGRDA